MILRAQAMPTKVILALHALHVATTTVLLDHNAAVRTRCSHNQFAKVVRTRLKVSRKACPLSSEEDPVRNLLQGIFPSRSAL